MKFHNLLSMRYMLTQKRHSVLTVCSITAALTLMTLMFTLFSTVMVSLRAYEYDARPYHIQLTPMTAEQCEKAEQAEGVVSCTFRENKYDGISWGEILFENGLEDEEKAVKSVYELASLPDDTIITENKTLMKYDFIGLVARYNFAVIFALFYVFILFLAISMRLVIDTAFEISSKEREKQFGILQSIGASPRQIVKIITCESTVLSVIGVPLGLLCGTGMGYAAFVMVKNSGILAIFYDGKNDKMNELLQFSVNPWLILAAAVTGFVWVWLSAYSTGMRIIKMSPVQAISGRSNKIEKVKRHSLLGLLFGWKGTLAARNTRRAPKRFAITVVSLTISITLFAGFDYVLDTYENTVEKMNKEIGMDFDLDIYRTKAIENPLDYKDDIKAFEDTGYFDEIRFGMVQQFRYRSDNTDRVAISHYLSEYEYNVYFGGNPPIPYDELASKDGYILIEGRDSDSVPGNHTSIEIEAGGHILFTEEEYNSLTEEEKTDVQKYFGDVDENGDMAVNYFRIDYKPYTVNIIKNITWKSVNEQYVSSNEVSLISSIDQYERDYEMYGNLYEFQRYYYYVTLAENAVYGDVTDFIERSGDYVIDYDMYIMNKTLESTLALVRIIVGFINAMVMVIALVNMINIISTGLINRRSELAAMQCVGMTGKQLLGLTVTECLQYALTAGIASTVICVGMIYVTMRLLTEMTLAGDFGYAIEYLKPLPTVWLGALAAFVTALAAAAVTHSSMKRRSLVENIRFTD